LKRRGWFYLRPFCWVSLTANNGWQVGWVEERNPTMISGCPTQPTDKPRPMLEPSPKRTMSGNCINIQLSKVDLVFRGDFMRGRWHFLVNLSIAHRFACRFYRDMYMWEQLEEIVLMVIMPNHPLKPLRYSLFEDLQQPLWHCECSVMQLQVICYILECIKGGCFFAHAN
jgi:hypothetical protein